MTTAYGNMTLRERITEVEYKQRRSVRNEEKSQDGFDLNDQDSKKRKRTVRRGAKFDHKGVHIETKKDLCDCLIEDCSGCFMPCPKCSSTKCGHECRRNRRWEYDCVEIEGTSLTIKNLYKK